MSLIRTIELLPVQQRALAKEPESGMGYQLVEAQIGGKLEKGVVLNSEILVTNSVDPTICPVN
jgi:hypothetical protein